MGIYISNYRDRLDISYILYNPQKPLITTRTAKYLYTDVLPSGENAIVAIMCYTGYKLICIQMFMPTLLVGQVILNYEWQYYQNAGKSIIKNNYSNNIC